LLAGVALLGAFPAAAQTATPPTDPAVVPPPEPTPAGSKLVFTPADFARFAPKTAYDMLVQVPGFTIRSGNTGERGLGQANENVLINGERIANKSYGGGDAGALAELQRISIANVERIEIVEAASLGIAGLSGQVANVIIKAQRSSSGQFEWRPDFRAHFAKPRIFNGNISYTGEMGPVTYTLSAKSQAGRGGFGGPIVLRHPDGTVFETREEIFHSEADLPTFSTKFALDGPDSSVGNLTLAYTPYWAPVHIEDQRTRTDGEDSSRLTKQTLTGWYYDINADYEFAVGPGRLKLIGLHHWDKEPVITTQVTDFEGDETDEGIRLTRDSRITETIGRAEYGWKMGGNDLQLSLERAFNKLDQRGALEVLNPEGEFVEVDFPEGSGTVEETRYEGIATFSRPLSSTLDLQVAAGGEISRLARVDDDSEERKFFRPKGSINLGWRPSSGWDVSLKLRRRVGQISFYDFLDQLNLQSDRENEGNPDLVPPQSWELETEVGRELGDWGKTRLRTYAHRIDDIIDVIPIGVDGQGIGNLPRATRIGIESTSTIQFEPIGWTGAKLDMTLGLERTSVRDPLTNEKRSISGTRDRWAYFEMRHDIPGTDYAWGLNASHDHFKKYYRLTEVFRSWEGPWWVGGFVEHKDIMGLTVRASVSNVLDARHRVERVIYEGFRDVAPIGFTQSQDQLIGPIFSFMVKGSF
jgi:hypothetical protein